MLASLIHLSSYLMIKGVSYLCSVLCQIVGIEVQLTVLYN
jgi:hypothetical protein